MRPVTDAPLHRRRLAAHAALAALAALALGGCSRDLDVPAPPASPTITGLTPAKAYAGQLVFVTGEHLELDATANTLNFPHASARGERWDGDRLVVRVPADAGDGPVTAGNRDGTSEPFGEFDFDYLGLGEPRRMQVASYRPILHRPRSVYAIAGDIVLHSELYTGLVWAGQTTLTTPAIALSAADPAGNKVYFAYDDALLGPQLYGMDATSGDLTGPAAPAVMPSEILALPAQGVVLTFHDDPKEDQVVDPLDGQITVTAWDAATLAPIDPEHPPTPVQVPTPLGMTYFAGAADVGDGRVVVAGDTPDGTTLGVFDVAPILAANPTTATPLAPMPCDPVPVPPDTCPLPELGWNYDVLRVPLAVGGTGTGRFAVAALSGGDVVIASLSSNAFTAVVETWGTADIESIAAGATSGIAVATKPGDGLSVLVDFSDDPIDGGSAVGSVPGSLPWVARADGDLAFIANKGDNDVEVVNLATQDRFGRVNFDVAPGAAAFVPNADGVDGDVVFPSTAFPGLLRLPTAVGDPLGLSRTAGIELLASDPDSRSVWAIANGDSSSPTLLSVAGYLDGAWDAPVRADLADGAAPQRAAARDHLLVVAHDSGLSIVDGDAPADPTVSAVPGADSVHFLGLGFTPVGGVWTVVHRIHGSWAAGEVQAQLWERDAVSGALEPSLAVTFPGTAWVDVPDPGPDVDATASVLAAAWLEDGLWIFWRDDIGSHATLLDATLSPVRTAAVPAGLSAIQAISPNGRLLVMEELNAAMGFPLRFFRADPAAGFPEIGSLVFDERVEGFTFDATGERLYVLTQLPDRVITVD